MADGAALPDALIAQTERFVELDCPHGITDRMQQLADGQASSIDIRDCSSAARRARRFSARPIAVPYGPLVPCSPEKPGYEHLALAT
ncbi:MAG TPA: hypothetical protein VGL53_16480, partial [Bryobacteraceae bacterium]